MEKDNINSTKHSHGCLKALRPCPTDYTLLATRYCSVRRLTQTSGDQSEIPKVDTTHDSVVPLTTRKEDAIIII